MFALPKTSHAGSQVNTVMGHRSTNGETVRSPWGAGLVPKWDRVEKNMS